MSTVRRKGAEEARNQLSELLDAAEKGRSTIITRHGRPVAALVPIDAHGASIRQASLMTLAGTGSRALGPQQCPCDSQAARRMEPLVFEDLPQQALLLLDTAPIIYVLSHDRDFSRLRLLSVIS